MTKRTPKAPKLPAYDGEVSIPKDEIRKATREMERILSPLLNTKPKPIKGKKTAR